MDEKKRVLVVDDDPLMRRAMARLLEERCDVVLAPDAPTALDRLSELGFDGVLADYRMPGRDGAWLLGQVRVRHPGVRLILYSGYIEQELADAMKASGVGWFLRKPITVEAVLACLEASS